MAPPLLLGLALAAGFAGVPAAAQQPARVLTMATGDVTGAYFPAGVALCRVVNRERRTHGLRCSSAPSQGSVANVAALRAGEAELALVQSDVQAAALAGTGAFAATGPFPDLRAVMALFPEPLTLLARPDAGIAALGDLAGKRVSVGPPGGGQRGLIEALSAAMGWGAGTFAETLDLDPSAAVNALCEGRIDAFFYAVGHPALAVTEATAACGARVIAVAGPEVEALVAGAPAYVAAQVPGGIYEGAVEPVQTFGVGATLVTTAGVDPAEIETVAGAILGALPDLAGFDATLAGLEPAAMSADGLTAPLHPGAVAAFGARVLVD